MIVRDESKIITRCLESIKNIFDNYVICDTGSVDDTKNVISKFMNENNKNGHLIDKEWVNFGSNKSYLLDMAFTKNLSKGAKYLMWLDADEVYLNEKDEYPTTNDKNRLLNFLNSKLDSGIFMMKTKYSNLNYMRWQIVRNNQLYMWKSPAHEYLVPSTSTNTTNITSLTLLARKEGNSSRDPNRTIKYIKMFREYLKEHPNSPRETFYLGISLTENRHFMDAIDCFKKRVENQTGFNQERYISMLRLGRIYFRQFKNNKEGEAWFSKASSEFLQRLEAPLGLLYIYFKTKNYEKGVQIIQQFSNVSRTPADVFLFAETDIYDWRFDLQASLIAFNAGEYSTALKYGVSVISRGQYPQKRYRR